MKLDEVPCPNNPPMGFSGREEGGNELGLVVFSLNQLFLSLLQSFCEISN